MRTEQGTRTVAALVFFRRKQDAVQERAHSSDCLLLDGLLGAPGTLVGLRLLCFASLRSARFSPAQASRVGSSWVEADSEGFFHQPRLSTLSNPGFDLMRRDLF